MRIKNTNKSFSTQQIKDIVRFVKPNGVSNFNINIKNSKGKWGGRAYVSGCHYGKNAGRVLVVVRIGENRFPFRYKPRRSGYLPWTVFTKLELLIHLTAHELRHLWQAKHPRGWRVWGARGQFSERDADAYAIHKVREWRRK